VPQRWQNWQWFTPPRSKPDTASSALPAADATQFVVLALATFTAAVRQHPTVTHTPCHAHNRAKRKYFRQVHPLATMTLEKVTNYAVLLLCGLVGAHVIYANRYLVISPPSPAGSYQAGQRLTGTSALSFKAAPKTLILVTASTCHYCSESMPFYQHLRGLAQSSGVRMVAVTAEKVDLNRDYLSRNGVTVDSVVSDVDAKVRVAATPTLILVGSDGTILQSWIGKLNPKQEKDVETAFRPA